MSMLLKFLSELLSRGCRVYWSLFRQEEKPFMD